MLGALQRLARLRGPLGVVALAVGVGLGAGIVATHAVLAAWTYRDAARRDLRDPGRWALAVLAGGIVTFPLYVALQRASDWSSESRAVGAVRRVRDRRERAGDPPAEGRDDPEADEASGVVDDESAGDGGAFPAVGAAQSEAASLVATTARYGLRAAGRGARWAAGRARRRLAE